MINLYTQLTPRQLREVFLNNLNHRFEFLDGDSPFRIKRDDEIINVYIKNLSPAQLSNNNPNVWRIQLPQKDVFDNIKNSHSLFLLLGYDSMNHVFTTWNPYWCKQRLNVGKSVSLYSRLSLQKQVNKTQTITKLELNNDGNVICIPEKKIGEYLLNIKQYFPKETEYIPIGSSIVKNKKNLHLQSIESFSLFCSIKKNANNFKHYLEHRNLNYDKYRNYVEYLFTSGLIGKYRRLFLENYTLDGYKNSLIVFFNIPEILALDQNSHGCYRESLELYLNSILDPLSDHIVSGYSIENGNNTLKTENSVPEYVLNEFGQLMSLDLEMREKMRPYFLNEEYPNYGKMIEIATNHYPKEITDKMSCVNWIKLFSSTDFKNISNSKYSNKKSSSKNHKTLRVTFPDGRQIQNSFAIDTFIQVVEECYPDLIIELGISHFGVDLISREYDEQYGKFQKKINGGYLVLSNTTTMQKYEDLLYINQELELGLKIELIEKPNIDVTQTISDSGRGKIRVVFPNGTVIQPSKVLNALVDVVKYAGGENVAKLNILVNYENLVTPYKSTNYPNASKLIPGGWYVNTASNTVKKYNQICTISELLHLNLKVDLL